MMEFLQIPDERKAIVIGNLGRTKMMIEKKTNTMIIAGDIIEISGEPEDVLRAKSVVAAIGRGFSPSRAFKLIQKGYILDIISLKGETSKTIKRLFGRVIGRSGLARQKIEDETNTQISVYGKTISIIGLEQDVESAHNAIASLLSGSTHGNVFGALERNKIKKSRTQSIEYH